MFDRVIPFYQYYYFLFWTLKVSKLVLIGYRELSPLRLQVYFVDYQHLLEISSYFRTVNDDYGPVTLAISTCFTRPSH